MKFVIVSLSRTGSTLLNDSLGNHPGYFSAGELFNFEDFPEAGARCGWQYLEEYFAKEGRAVGFKMLEENALGLPHVAGWLFLQMHQEIRVVHTVRRNALARNVSSLTAESDGIWRISGEWSPSEPLLQITLSPLAWLALMQRDDERNSRITGLFSRHRYLRVFYEDLRDAWEETILSVQGFLGLQPQALPQVTTKKRSFPLRAQLPNCQELEDVFRQCDRQHLLDD